MSLFRREKFVRASARYECPRCGDTLMSETKDDLMLVKVHRLLHLAADWRASFQPTTHWIINEEGARAVLD